MTKKTIEKKYMDGDYNLYEEYLEEMHKKYELERIIAFNKLKFAKEEELNKEKR